ncbi:glycoside hydrolase superfamily [Fusarium oxysporum Fo47]|uniref:glycoside hydrolase superfamily n=1 Tax=Fusarium oxysporum Fo47 TaxID=660027 RepID=UPI0028699642|nr:glycoside hydrolase superfamily [Fusarium oxysporum Fo47]QKD57157.2 glycoside hydrolase superfamily [Fusarium oxysporum Fo47]
MESFNLPYGELLQHLTTSEKISLLSGSDFWHTQSIPRLSVPKLRMSDGPNGVRGTKFFNSVPAACLPCGTGLAATWSHDMMREAGDLIARECHAKSAHVWLGPTTNIQRSPLGGRGFESFSEDPLLGGSLASALISNVQKNDIACSLKHFVANDMEHERTLVDCRISPRALREIYLLPFQIAIRDADPWALMTAYNKVNGQHMSEHQDILQEILRNEWGYRGCIMSDWFGTYSTAAAINNGLDLEMPGPTEQRGKRVATALGVGKIRSSTIDARVASVLRLADRVRESGIPECGPESCLDTDQDRSVLRRLATESVVLLKNDDHVLPFRADKKTVVIGPNAQKSFFCGGGSASLRPTRVVSILEGLRDKLEQPVEYTEACQIYNQLPVLGDIIRAPDGTLGQFLMSIYTSPPTMQQLNNNEITDTREAIEVLQLDDSNVVLYDYSNPAAPDNVVYATIAADLVVDNTDTYAFSLTVAGTATLYLDNDLIVDNSHDQKRGTSFFGSGSAEKIKHVQLVANRVYKLRCEFGSAATSNLNKAGAPVFGAGGVRIGCARCSNESLELDRAVELAKEADQVVVCVGLGPEWESEGSDRALYELPGRQSELLSRVTAVNKNVVVIVQSGTPVSGPWDQVAAVMQTWYGGNELGHGIADIVLGRESPSGKLPLSWPCSIEDNPSFLSYRSEAGTCYYNEDIFVGYRFYEKARRKVQWPFGFGLSYASFILEQPSVQIRGSGVDANMLVTVPVYNNSAATSGKEVIQVYVSCITPSAVRRPVKELKGFTKLFVPAGETRQATIEIPIKTAVSVWDVTTDSWLMEKGTYKLSVGNSSDSALLSTQFQVPVTQHWSGL